MKMNNETRIGIMVAAAVAMLFILTVKAGNFNVGRKGYIIKVHFRNIDGIEKNTPVMYNGFEVGLVKEITIKETDTETLMEIDAWIEDGVQIREGAKAHVKNMGFLGEKYVSLTAGVVGSPYMAEGAVVVGDEPADMDKLLRDGQDIAKNVKEAAANINERLKTNQEEIDSIIGNFDVTMKNMVSITNNVDERLRVNRDKIDHIMTNLSASSENLEEFSYDLKLNPWKLLYKPPKDRRNPSLESK
jgi:phospholipid/cholesterol/gamma-HCH transport system substrate-binding protein